MVSFGLISHSASSVMPHFAIWPPRKPSTRMSACFSSSKNQARPAPSFTFMHSERVLRRSICVPQPCSAWFVGREVSRPRGLSTPMTSAPRSASRLQANGPAMAMVRLTTFTPCSGPNFGQS